MEKQEKFFDPQTARFLASIAMALRGQSSPDMDYWNNKPLRLQRVLNLALDPSQPWMTVENINTIYMADKILSLHSFYIDIATEKLFRNYYEGKLVRQDRYDDVEETQLEIISLRELGLNEGHESMERTIMAAGSQGLVECPIEAVLSLRKKYTNQPKNECLYIGMKQIAGQIFIIINQELRLVPEISTAEANDHYSPKTLWVFKKIK